MTDSTKQRSTSEALRRDRADGVAFTYEDDLVTATDLETGVASCGETKAEALSMLAEALTLHDGRGESVGDERAFSGEIGIDPDDGSNEPIVPPWHESEIESE
jgi:hypothetical protein